MRLLTLKDVRAISGPERGQLVETDDAIRDIIDIVARHAADNNLDAELISRATISLLLAAAAKQALAEFPNCDAEDLANEFAGFALDAVSSAKAVVRRRLSWEIH